ncbi:MAG: hypothetical protein KGD74_07550 [Candidatus Lokiarchaeota archaeon]|nr:hypothetical protein [Candidatus Lokiarchaeota archaeon]
MDFQYDFTDFLRFHKKCYIYIIIDIYIWKIAMGGICYASTVDILPNVE